MSDTEQLLTKIRAAVQWAEREGESASMAVRQFGITRSDLAHLADAASCLASTAPYPQVALHCTLPKEHEGEHVAHGTNGEECGRWP